MVDLKAKPYNLSEEDIKWVEETIASLSDEEKVKKSDFIVFDGMSRELESRTANWEKHLQEAYNQGKKFFQKD